MTAPYPMRSSNANNLCGAEGVEAVHECDADVDFVGMAIGVASGDAFAEGLEAAHPRFDAAKGVGYVRLTLLQAGQRADQRLAMIKRSPFKYFKSSPETIRLAVMLYVRFPLPLRNVELNHA